MSVELDPMSIWTHKNSLDDTYRHLYYIYDTYRCNHDTNDTWEYFT